MQTVEETVDVAVSAASAFEQWGRFESFPQFMSGVESVTPVSRRVSHWVVNIGGAEREFDTEMVEYLPGERITWRSTDGTSHTGTVSFTPLGAESTRVWVRLQWAPETFTEKAGAVLGFDNMQVRADLRRFKEYIEAKGPGADTRRREDH